MIYVVIAALIIFHILWIIKIYKEDSGTAKKKDK